MYAEIMSDASKIEYAEMGSILCYCSVYIYNARLGFCAPLQVYLRDDIIIREGEVSREMYFIKSGAVQVRQDVVNKHKTSDKHKAKGDITFFNQNKKPLGCWLVRRMIHARRYSVICQCQPGHCVLVCWSYVPKAFSQLMICHGNIHCYIRDCIT